MGNPPEPDDGDSTRSSPVPPPGDLTRVPARISPSGRWSRPPEDLSRDRLLKNSPRVNLEGEPRPALGRFALLSKIGQGGMGVVYHGAHAKLGTEVAIKVLPIALHAQQHDLVERFEREARFAAQLRSEHLVSVLDIDEDAPTGCHFIVMEFVRGAGADLWMRRHPAAPRVPEAEALDVVIAATRGLVAAHLNGVVHRDIKPANILIPFDAGGLPLLGKSKLADLGLARAEASEQNLTTTALAMGTPGYMAPEQARDAKRAKKPADVFSVGATLYSILTGKAPFAGTSPADAIVRTAIGEYPPLRAVRPDVTPATEALVDTCLQADPAARFPDATALLDALLVARTATTSGGAAASVEAQTRFQALVARPERGKPVETPRPPALETTAPDPAVNAGTRVPSDVDEARRLETGRDVTEWTPSASVLGAAGVQSATEAPAPRKLSLAVVVGALVLGVAAVVVAYIALTPGRDAVSRPGPGTPPASNLAPGVGAPRAAPARLSVATVPPGADVLVDGSSIGMSPLDGAEVPAGAHVVTFRLAEHGDAQRRIVLAAGRPEDLGRVSLRPWPVIDLTEPGPEVSATVDGTPRSGEVAVAPGRHRIVLSRPLHADQTEEREYALGERVRPKIADWARFQARLDLTALPQDASATVDGAPASGIVPLAAAREVEVCVSRPDLEPQTVRVRVELGRTVPPKLSEWRALGGALDLSGFGDDVRFLLDGKAVADGARLPQGTHALRAVREGFESQDVTATIVPGQRTRPTLGDWTPVTTALDPAARKKVLTDLRAWDAATSDQRRLAAEWVDAAEADFALLRVETFTCGGRTHEVAVFAHAPTGMEFVLVPAGTFLRGSSETEALRVSNEGQHRVTLTRPFLLARTETTQAAYAKVAGACTPEFPGPARPVERVTWDEAAAFCTSARLALPTEAQWEHACRAGTTSAWSFGGSGPDLQRFAWYEPNAGGATHDAAAKPPNALGLFDLHGNVAEWCADGYDPYPTVPVTDPAGKERPTHRVVRGGSWREAAGPTRSAGRVRQPPGHRAADVGFRPAKTVRAE